MNPRLLKPSATANCSIFAALDASRNSWRHPPAPTLPANRGAAAGSRCIPVLPMPPNSRLPKTKQTKNPKYENQIHSQLVYPSSSLRLFPPSAAQARIPAGTSKRMRWADRNRPIPCRIRICRVELINRCQSLRGRDAVDPMGLGGTEFCLLGSWIRNLDRHNTKPYWLPQRLRGS